MIRFVIGFLIVFGAVGGIDTATDSQLLVLVLVAAAGLGLMAAGSGKVAVVYR